MSYPEEERRKNAVKLEDFNELKLNVAVFTEKVSNWMDSTKTYRSSFCEKMDTIINEIANINNRCFSRTEDYVLFKDHLKNSNSIKSFWRDKNFQIVLALVSPIYIVMVGMAINWFIRK